MSETPLSIVVERELPYPPEKVWRALTDPQIVKQWLLENDLQAETGRRFTLRAPARPGWNGTVQCEVLAIEPGRLISYSWVVPGPQPGTGLDTVVTWTLAANGAGTRLRMEHTGFRPDQGANLEGAKFGWQMFLGRLDKTLPELP